MGKKLIPNLLVALAVLLNLFVPQAYAGAPAIPPAALTSIGTANADVYYRKAKILSENARAAKASNPRILPTMVAAGTAPTITANGTTNPNAAGSAKTILANQDQFLIAGTPVLAQAVYRIKNAVVAPTGGNIGLNNGAQASVARVSIMVDGTTVTWRVGPSTAKYRFLVDDQYVDLTGTQTVATSGSTHEFITLDFTSVGGKKPRKMTLEMQQTDGVVGVYTEASGRIYRVARPVNFLKAISLGDSYIGGYSQVAFYGDLHRMMLADWLGVDVMTMSGSGGTRWGSDTGTSYSFGNRIANGDLALAGYTPDIIILQGSPNDYAQVAADVTNNSAAAIALVRQQYPGALIFVFGVYDAGSGTQAQNLAMENALFAGVAASGVTRGIATIPISGDTNGPWVAIANRSTVIGADNIHPSETGEPVLAAWESAAILKSLETMVY